jgi:CPA1 family monovalent cation:H+ antiporter
MLGRGAGGVRVARDEGRIPEEVLVRAQRQLDLEESMLERSEE